MVDELNICKYGILTITIFIFLNIAGFYIFSGLLNVVHSQNCPCIEQINEEVQMNEGYFLGGCAYLNVSGSACVMHPLLPLATHEAAHSELGLKEDWAGTIGVLTILAILGISCYLPTLIWNKTKKFNSYKISIILLTLSMLIFISSGSGIIKSSSNSLELSATEEETEIDFEEYFDEDLLSLYEIETSMVEVEEQYCQYKIIDTLGIKLWKPYHYTYATTRDGSFCWCPDDMIRHSDWQDVQFYRMADYSNASPETMDYECMHTQCYATGLLPAGNITYLSMAKMKYRIKVQLMINGTFYEEYLTEENPIFEAGGITYKLKSEPLCSSKSIDLVILNGEVKEIGNDMGGIAYYMKYNRIHNAEYRIKNRDNIIKLVNKVQHTETKDCEIGEEVICKETQPLQVEIFIQE